MAVRTASIRLASRFLQGVAPSVNQRRSVAHALRARTGYAIVSAPGGASERWPGDRRPVGAGEREPARLEQGIDPPPGGRDLAP